MHDLNFDYTKGMEKAPGCIQPSAHAAALFFLASDASKDAANKSPVGTGPAPPRPSREARRASVTQSIPVNIAF